MYFSILGPVGVWRGGTELPVGPPQQRLLLALLLAYAGRPVPLEEAVDVMWGEDAPLSAVNIVQRHVGMLRRLLEPDLPRMAAGRWILRDAGGYRLDVDARTLDLLKFRGLLDEARDADRSGRPEQAVEAYATGLALWRGPAAAGVPAESQGHPVFTSLDRERLAAAKDAAEVALRCGAVTPVLAELQRLADRYPLDEPLQSRLVLALSATGHRAEALDAFRLARARLADGLGIDPGPELLAAQSRALRGHDRPRRTLRGHDRPAAGDGTGSREPSPEAAAAALPPDAPAPGAAGAPADESIAVVPAQLPHDHVAFAGRRSELDCLLSLLPADGTAPRATLIITIGGLAGIGKTTLAIHLAHQVAHRFPDGQLYVNLRGYDPGAAATDPAEVLRGCLTALGTGHEDIPADLDARSALYRSLLAGRRMLIVLDNARDAAQVRPLLPGAAGCLALVTSRSRLTSLVAGECAHPLPLDVLSSAEARDFLAQRLGPKRTAREPQAVAEIVTRCGGLPLALAVVAARAATNPAFALATLAAELRATRGTLEAFGEPGSLTEVRSVFSWSYHALGPDAARLFRLLALHPGPDIGLPAAASLAGVLTSRIRSLAGELIHAGLATEHTPGRYALHDLLRAYAAELADRHDPPQERDAARRRNFDHYLHTAQAAEAHYGGRLIPLTMKPAAPGVSREPIADRTRAIEWFRRELPVLLAVIRQADTGGHDDHTWKLVRAVEYHLGQAGRWEEGVQLAQTALEAAVRTLDPIAQAHAHRSVARFHHLLHRGAEARTHLKMALDFLVRVGDVAAQAGTLDYIGFVAERAGWYAEAVRNMELAFDLYKALDDGRGEAAAYNAIGYLYSILGNLDIPLPYCRQAGRLFQELGDQQGEGAAWDSLGHTFHRLGRPEEAVPCYLNALELIRDVGAGQYEAVILDHLGDAWRDSGEVEEARSAWREAAALHGAFDSTAGGPITAKLDELGAPVRQLTE